jgi:hypothetical protein
MVILDRGMNSAIDQDMPYLYLEIAAKGEQIFWMIVSACAEYL